MPEMSSVCHCLAMHNYSIQIFIKIHKNLGSNTVINMHEHRLTVICYNVNIIITAISFRPRCDQVEP